MKFLYLWPFFLILLVPIIILMYLLKQKAVEHPFSSLFLWNEMYHNVEANTPWEKLKKNWLLILQIITILFLIIALASPYLLKGGAGADHVILVIDNSGSMNTSYDGSMSRLDYAKEQAVSYVKDLKSGTGISVITSAQSAVLMSSNEDDKADVINQIKGIEPTNLSGSCASGIEMVRSMQSQWQSVETVCFSDTYASMENVQGYMVDMFMPQENACIEYVGHGLNNGKLTILAKVTNYGTNPLTTDVTLYGNDELLDIKTVTVASMDSEVVYYENVDYSGDVLYAELSTSDALAEDNRCYDVLTEQKENQVLLMTDANLYLEKALGLADNIVVTKSNDIDSFTEFANEKYDLYIFDGMVPAQLPKSGNIIIINGKCDTLYNISETLGGVMVEAQKRPVTKYLEDFSFGVSSTYAFELPEWAETFLSVDSKPVAFLGQYGTQTICVLGFDFHNSDLPLKVEFPLMIYNIMNECVSSGMLSQTVTDAGNAVSINGKLEEGYPKLTKPDKEVTEFSDYVATYTDTQELGQYEVEQEIKGTLQKAYFVVNFPSSESIVTQVPSELSQEDSENVKTSVDGILNLRNMIILLALGLLGVEWVAFLRK